MIILVKHPIRPCPNISLIRSMLASHKKEREEEEEGEREGLLVHSFDDR